MAKNSAHPIPPTSLTGQILIAMPALDDPEFDRSVVYLCAHGEDGAMGLVINRPLSKPSFPDLLRQLNLGDTPPARAIALCKGGPVENARGFVLHSTDWTGDDSLLVDDDVALTASLDILKAIAEGGGPHHGILALGCANWGPGQLDREMRENAWLTVEADADLLFGGEHDAKWSRAMSKLNITPGRLSSLSGSA
jgi:putative transcriptional regulator